MADDVIDETAGYGLLLSFSGLYPTMPEEHAFVHGVEFGGIWARMRAGAEAEIEATVHAANRGAITRATASQGWSVEWTVTDYPEWVVCMLRKIETARHNPHGLRVVSSK